MKIGSLFTGSGQLDEGVKAALGGDVAWHVEFDKAASAVLAHNYPGVPNHRDVTSVDWSAVEPVNVITGGFPCQDVSAAGKRAGLGEGTRSGLWAEMHHAVDVLRPSLVVIENVRGLLSARTDTSRQLDTIGPKGGRKVGYTDRAIGRVVADLAAIGYDATWVGLRASDAGAAHQRFRVFILGHPADTREQRRDGLASVERGGWLSPLGGEASDHAGDSRRLDAPDASDVGHEWRSGARDGRSGSPDGGLDASDTTSNPWRVIDRDVTTSSDPDNPGSQGRESAGRRLVSAWGAAADSSGAERRGAQPDDLGARLVAAAEPRECASPVAWGKYEPAIRRWERTVGRVAPSPTEPGPKGGHRLSPTFVEWLMGWPAGWVTDVPGLTRNDQLKICGNGVVPQQAELAIRTLLNTKENT